MPGVAATSGKRFTATLPVARATPVFWPPQGRRKLEITGKYSLKSGRQAYKASAIV
jgi:hypothetical protein